MINNNNVVGRVKRESVDRDEGGGEERKKKKDGRWVGRWVARHCYYMPTPYLGMVIHLVLASCVVMAFSNSSRPPHFFSFFTRLFTAFSDHLSSLSESPFFQPNRRFTIGGVNGDREFISLSLSRTHTHFAFSLLAHYLSLSLTHSVFLAFFLFQISTPSSLI